MYIVNFSLYFFFFQLCKDHHTTTIMFRDHVKISLHLSILGVKSQIECRCGAEAGPEGFVLLEGPKMEAPLVLNRVKEPCWMCLFTSVNFCLYVIIAGTENRLWTKMTMTMWKWHMDIHWAFNWMAISILFWRFGQEAVCFPPAALSLVGAHQTQNNGPCRGGPTGEKRVRSLRWRGEEQLSQPPQGPKYWTDRQTDRLQHYTCIL